MRRFYLLGAIVGTVVPYIFLVTFFITNGFDLGLFLDQLFSTPAAAMFTADLLITSMIFWYFLFREGRRLDMKYLWVYVVLNLAVGLSLALPLFLYFRAPRLEG